MLQQYQQMIKPKEDTRPRLLFLAFNFPPFHSVGSIRALNIAKYLTRKGWVVNVVTPDPALWQSPDSLQSTLTDLDNLGINRIYTGHRWRCLSEGNLKRAYNRGIRWFLEGIPRRLARTAGVDEMIGWYPEVEKACVTLLPGSCDIVLATGSPFGSFRTAQRLARRLQCPYVLDYRDLWHGNPHAKGFRSKRLMRTENQVLRDAAAVSVVSPSMSKYLENVFGITGKVHVIPNGYSPDDFEHITAKEFGHFAIVYAGRFYPPKRTARTLMKVLRRLSEFEHVRPWLFHYYGPQTEHVIEVAKANDVENLIELHGMTSRRECLEAIRGAGIATVIISEYDTGDLADLGIITGKIFEPIGLGTPVLAIAPPNSDVETVVNTAGNGAVFPGSDIDGIASFLASMIQGNTLAMGNPELYAWTALGLEMESLLRSVCNSSLNITVP